ncbi:MAG: tRNA uridine-5-carboxymethylaminomethyl(34) synthesis GTPase MnmE [Treponema sp.]|nr:tRNA uridine-5-carboxymethylaminomethyl(34) synthesis GTPase MnmE [Treponema sp.]
MTARAFYGDDSPVAAFATAPGASALTLIRCSGAGAVDLVARVFSAPRKLLAARGNTILRGWIVSPERQRIDEVLVSIFRAPKSYTGEDGVDISCHGGLATGGAVMAQLRGAGFRDALPGEFTFRAFLNGKMDLTRCEAVMELVCARGEKARGCAVGRLSGALESEINAIKKNLVEVSAGAEIFLDYSEDEISASAEVYADPGALPGEGLARAALARLRDLSQTWRTQRLYRDGIVAAFAGLPNVGKSSLFNLLLKEERAIVTEVPGTTRDWIEAELSVDGIPLRLIDTAGLREAGDPVEAIGVRRSREILESADLVLYVFDGAKGIQDGERAIVEKGAPRRIFLWNKADIAPPPSPAPFDPMIGISARTGAGLGDLLSAISLAARDCAGPLDARSLAFVGTERQKSLLDAAAAALEEALALSGSGEPLDMIAPLLRDAVNCLGEITGEVSSAQMLEEMFSAFCVGK